MKCKLDSLIGNNLVYVNHVGPTIFGKPFVSLVPISHTNYMDSAKVYDRNYMNFVTLYPT